MLRKLRGRLGVFDLPRPSIKEKVFYVSLQRCGTKSFSKFFGGNGFKTASWDVAAKNSWPAASLDGQYHQIIDSKDFRRNQVFDDGPWHHLPLMRFLYWNVPDSRFIFFERPFEDWLQSMKSHSGGRVLGDPKRHCMVYNRLPDYYKALENGTLNELKIEGAEDIYARAFKNHTLQIRAFFEDRPAHRFFYAELYDKDKYRKLAKEWSIEFDSLSDVHVHRTGYAPQTDYARR